MKKVFLKCYLIKNLGDDLFLKIISERYKDNFYLISSLKYDDFKNENVKITYRNFFIKVFDKICKILKIKYSYEKYLINKSDIVVVLAGSIFMENRKDIKIGSWYEGLNKDYYILGSNIGPYKTNEFLDDVRNVIKNSKDTCLRDKKSFNLCEGIGNVRYASDVIFSLDVSKYNVPEKKKVVFSVINCDKKSRQIKNPDRDAYENKICELINYFQDKDYEIELMSFCKKEGDEEAIESILNKIKNRENIKTYFYDGNLKEALKELSSAKIIVGTRFHANVIGMIMNKTVIPIVYNNKTEEVLKDIDFKGKKIYIDNIGDFDVNSISEKDLEYKCDINTQKKDANKHFEKLDGILEKRRK